MVENGMDDTLTMTEAARRLGVSRVKVRALIKEGALPAMTNPLDKRERRIPVVAIEQLEARSRFMGMPGQSTMAGPAQTSTTLPTGGLDPARRSGDRV
jgi:excisionase family DNA binding protein